MGQFVKGDIVKVLFRFSDLSNAKPRPALVLSDLRGEDSILCQITKKCPKLDQGIKLLEESFVEDPLSVIPSFIRPVRIFISFIDKIDSKITSVTKETLGKVYAVLNSIFVA